MTLLETPVVKLFQGPSSKQGHFPSLKKKIFKNTTLGQQIFTGLGLEYSSLVMLN